MKTTLDLPTDLVKRLKLKAVHDGKKLKDVAADVLRAGLRAEKEEVLEKPVIVKSKRGIPLIICKHPAKAEEELTPDKVADILLAQEIEWARNAR